MQPPPPPQASLLAWGVLLRTEEEGRRRRQTDTSSLSRSFSFCTWSEELHVGGRRRMVVGGVGKRTWLAFNSRIRQRDPETQTENYLNLTYLANSLPPPFSVTSPCAAGNEGARGARSVGRSAMSPFSLRLVGRWHRPLCVCMCALIRRRRSGACR